MISVRISETKEYDERSIIMNCIENAHLLASQLFDIFKNHNKECNFDFYVEAISDNIIVYNVKNQNTLDVFNLMYVYSNLKFIPSLKGNYGNLSFKDKLYILVERIVNKIGLDS